MFARSIQKKSASNIILQKLENIFLLLFLPEDGDQEGCGLAGAGLGAGHQVPPVQDHGDGVLLHGRGLRTNQR